MRSVSIGAKRDVWIARGVVFVPLTKGRVATLDEADLRHIHGMAWTAQEMGRSCYAVHAKTRGLRFLMHRLILGAPEGVEVDHVDGDGLNNRRHNLRLATRRENGSNRRLNVNNKSGYRGVCFRENTQRWQAQIKVAGRTIYLGQFATSDEAGAAYAEAAAHYHGQFARAAAAGS